MAYCLLADIEKHLSEMELIQLTDDAGNGSVNSDVVADAIEDADAAIDGYLARRYVAPLDPVPVLIQHISADIAIYNLLCRRSGAMTDVRKDRYDAAMRQLGDLSKGLAVLTLDVEAPAVLQDSAQVSASARVFGDTGLAGY